MLRRNMSVQARRKKLFGEKKLSNADTVRVSEYQVNEAGPVMKISNIRKPLPPPKATLSSIISNKDIMSNDSSLRKGSNTYGDKWS